MAATGEGVVVSAGVVGQKMSENHSGNEDTQKRDQTTCAFFVARKRRNCKLLPAKGMKFCTEHIHLSSDKEHYESINSRQRIPCPLNPKHSCFQDQLQRHLERCNAREKLLGPYHVKDVNSGSVEDDLLPAKFRLADANPEEVVAVVRRIQDIVGAQQLIINEEVLEHELLKQDLLNSELGRTLKHLKQEASLLGHMDREGFLEQDDSSQTCSSSCYLEFGAGRARLASDVIRAVSSRGSNAVSSDVAESHSESARRSPPSFILVERWRTRNKRENQHRYGKEVASVERIRLDIKDLALGRHPTVANCSSLVAFGKHVCGAATDLSLRCLMTTLNSNELAGGEPPAKLLRLDVDAIPSAAKLRGIVIALCCHHQCRWRDYVGKSFWCHNGLTPRQFQIASCMSAWATCAFERNICETGSANAEAAMSRDSEEDDSDHECCSDTADKANLDTWTVSQKEDIGRVCKRVIDLGRMAYLTENGFTSRLAFYVSPSTSLENVVLIAKPIHRSCT